MQAAALKWMFDGIWDRSEHYAKRPERSEKPILLAENITVKFGEIVAVDNVTVEVKQGELLAIIGPNGAGKTSLLNVISGFYKPVTGRVVFKGQDISKMPPHKRVELGLSRTFQHSQLFLGMTVLDNIIVGLFPWRRTSTLAAAFWLGNARKWEEWARESVEYVIDLLELHEYRYRIVGSLSPGLQKRVDLARALVQNPEVVLMDEPMAGLTREEKEDLARAIIEVHETRGTTFVMVEHDLEVVTDIADRIIVMDSGRVIAEGEPEEVVHNPRVIHAYVGG